jgi:Flp pilus assembly CpaF family ATPase
MTDIELLAEVKKGLSIPASNTVFDSVLTQKIKAVKSYMSGAGVSQELLSDDLAVEVIVLGVTDIWKLDGGEVKLSPAFNMLLTQLVFRS